jgi:hypothetical protein
MKVLFVLDNYSKYFSIDDVVRELYRRRHDVVLVMGLEEKRNVPDDAVQKAKADSPNLIIEPLLKRKFLRKFTRDIRELLNYAHILNNEEARQWDASKWSRFFRPYVWRMITSDAGKGKMKDRTFQKTLRFIEQKIPVVARIRDHIKRHNPNLVIALPLINADSKENEYIKAALVLGIPCVYSMYSWDNIDSKATFQSRPDYNIVWNKPLAETLSKGHTVSPEKIFITGAPRFDRLVESRDEYILPREEFCRIAGINATKKYILYVGSTFLVNSEFKKAMNEDAPALEIAEALLQHPNTRDVNVLVRPHPSNAGIVKNLWEQKRHNVAVYPAHGEFPDTEEKRRMFYNSLHHSIAVVGINTTAFLEASALDKPCITIVTKEFGETQQLPHFHHLVDGDFLETANGASEVVEIVKRIIDGADTHSAQRRAFVGKFLKSPEPGKSAAEVYADLVEKLGSKQ